MYGYEFCISKNGKFLFRTDKSSDYNEHLFIELKSRFPEKDGFCITVNKYKILYQSNSVWF